MSVVEVAALGLVGLFLLVAVVRLFRKPLKLAARGLVNSGLGRAASWAAMSALIPPAGGPAGRRPGGADAGRQLVQRADGGRAGRAGAGAAASGEVGAGVGT